MYYAFWVKRSWEAPELVRVWASSELAAQLAIDQRYGRNVFRTLAGVSTY